MPKGKKTIKQKPSKRRLLKNALTRTSSTIGHRRIHREIIKNTSKGKRPVHDPTAHRLRQIAQLTGAITSSQPLRQQARQMAEQVCSVFAADACVIRELEGDELTLLACAGIPKKCLFTRLPAGYGLAKMIISRSQALFLPKQRLLAMMQPIRTRLRSCPYASYVGTPIIARDSVIGIIGVYWEEDIKEFSESDMGCLQILGNSIAGAIANDRLYQEVKSRGERLKSEMAELQKAKASLQKSEELHRLLAYNSVDMISRHASDGTVLYVSQACAALSGYTQEELIGQPAEFLWHPEEVERIWDAIGKSQKAGDFYQIEHRLRRKDGSFIWVETMGRPVRDASGRIVEMQCNCRDITDRKQAEAALRASDERFRAVLENSLDAAYRRCLSTDQFDYMSPVIEGIVGFSPAEIRKFGMEELLERVHPDDRATVRHQLQQTPVGGRAVIEYRFRCKDGQYRWLADASHVMADEQGRPFYCVGIIRDLTGSKRVEMEREQLHAQLQQAQKMEAVGRLSGGIAHDFNNLLTVIQGNVELGSIAIQTGMTGPSADRLAGSLNEIGHAAERGANLTRQLLTFSRKHMNHVEVIDVGSIVRDTDKMLRRLIRQDIAVEITCDPGEHLIKMDKTQIVQVLVNLAVNARDAMPQGGKLSIEVATVMLDEQYVKKHVDASAGAHVRIAVTDTGKGIDDATREHMYEPFYTTKPFGKGSGLGLSIIYGITKQAGGHISVKSKPGKGSTFSIYYPSVQEEVTELEKTSDAEWECGDETILLCEDETSLRRLSASVLAECGYRVIEAENGEQAIRLAADHAGQFHLLITDVVMPGVKGDKVAEMILKRQPNLPVLFVSGYTSDILRGDGQEKLDFLQKPYKPDALLKRVRALLDGAGK